MAGVGTGDRVLRREKKKRKKLVTVNQTVQSLVSSGILVWDARGRHVEEGWHAGKHSLRPSGPDKRRDGSLQGGVASWCCEIDWRRTSCLDLLGTPFD